MHLNRILERQGRGLDGCFYVDMPNTFLLYWDVPSEEQFGELDARARDATARVAQAVRDREPVTEYGHAVWALEHIVFPMCQKVSSATRYFGLENAFYAEDACSRCGSCEQICVSGRISMSGGKPSWDPDIPCEFCFACIHSCPEHAIQLSKTKSKQRGRYRHPEVSIHDLAEQSRRSAAGAGSRA